MENNTDTNKTADPAPRNEKSAREFSVSSAPIGPRFRRMPHFARLGYTLPRLRRRLRLATIAALSGVVAVSALVGYGASRFEAERIMKDNLVTTSLGSQKQIVTSESQLIGNIARTVGPSVVSVNVTSTSQGTSNFFGYVSPRSQQSAGTGIILTSSGLIITNRHVVPSGTTTVSVTLADGTELKDVSVIGRTGASSSLDVAFLQINNAKGKKLTPAQLGDSSKVQVGDDVVAIGNALGQFQNTVTSGIISGYGRSVQASSADASQTPENLDNLFQTDAAINEGNSGGPLVNLNGQVIGINTAIAGNAQNIGFAIPVNDVIGLVRQVEGTGKLQQPYLGVYYVPLTDDVAQQYSLSSTRGAWIPPMGVVGQSPIVSGGPADKAGLQAGDIITKIDGITIDQGTSLTSILDKDQVGQTVTLTVLRQGKTSTIKVVLGAAPVDTTTQ